MGTQHPPPCIGGKVGSGTPGWIQWFTYMGTFAQVDGVTALFPTSQAQLRGRQLERWGTQHAHKYLPLQGGSSNHRTGCKLCHSMVVELFLKNLPHSTCRKTTRPWQQATQQIVPPLKMSRRLSCKKTAELHTGLSPPAPRQMYVPPVSKKLTEGYSSQDVLGTERGRGKNRWRAKGESSAKIKKNLETRYVRALQPAAKKTKSVTSHPPRPSSPTV